MEKWSKLYGILYLIFYRSIAYMYICLYELTTLNTSSMCCPFKGITFIEPIAHYHLWLVFLGAFKWNLSPLIDANNILMLNYNNRLSIRMMDWHKFKKKKIHFDLIWIKSIFNNTIQDPSDVHNCKIKIFHCWKQTIRFVQFMNEFWMWPRVNRIS